MKIVQKSIKFLTVVAIALCSFNVFAGDSGDKHDKQDNGETSENALVQEKTLKERRYFRYYRW